MEWATATAALFGPRQQRCARLDDRAAGLGQVEHRPPGLVAQGDLVGKDAASERGVEREVGVEERAERGEGLHRVDFQGLVGRCGEQGVEPGVGADVDDSACGRAGQFDEERGERWLEVPEARLAGGRRARTAASPIHRRTEVNHAPMHRASCYRRRIAKVDV
jgi:hypothetical protein